MFRSFLVIFFGMISLSISGQSMCEQSDSTFRVLHFTKTTGYDHGTRNNSNTLFSEIGATKGFSVTNTELSSFFDNLDSLLLFSAIVFSNTSGNTIFDANQKANMESYMEQGGSFIGIHAATDTYRTGWPFYNELVGAIVQTNPNHTNSNHNNYLDHSVDHQILSGLPDPWQKTEEYYYWDLNGGMIDTINTTELLRVRNTGNDSYDHDRAMAWFRIFPEGGRSFYTALGHSNSNYTDPTNEFRLLLSNAVCWAAYNRATGPKIDATVDITNSDLSIKDAGSGLILSSPNGSCYKMGVSNEGKVTLVNIPCPSN